MIQKANRVISESMLPKAKRVISESMLDKKVESEIRIREDYTNTYPSKVTDVNPNIFEYCLSSSFLIDNELLAVKRVSELGQLAIIPSLHPSMSSKVIKVNFNEEREIYKLGVFHLNYGDWFFIVKLGEANSGEYVLNVYSPDPEAIIWFKEKYEYYRVQENIYKGKAIKIDRGILKFIHPKPSDFSNLVLDSKIKENVYDQTIFFLENMMGMNGLILYGDPGTGKSYTSASLAYEAIKRGITVISLYNINTNSILELKDFIIEYCHNVLVCIEDIDSAGKSREDYDSSNSLAPLLEFMDGFGSNSNISCVVLATTNHLDKLDKAIGERPCRFNRKIFFDYLGLEQTTSILKKLFGEGINDEHLKILKNKSKITPSHLAEIYRTATLMQLKYKTLSPLDHYFIACEEVLESFSPTLNSKPLGFDTGRED